jgi:starch-binding outer membrane protein, SusD/RagB family
MKMKDNNINKLRSKTSWMLSLVLTFLVLGACSDSFFDVVPSDRILPEQHFNSKTDAELSANAPLAILRDIMPQIVFASDLRSDMTEITANADANWKNIYYHENSSPNPYLDPSAFYRLIINANESLLYIDSIVSKDKDMTQVYVDVYKGNLIGARAWAYFMLVRLYGEVAYIPDNMSQMPAQSLNYIGREAILDTLENHLLPYLNIDYIDVGNISMYNKALLGEIYLEKQDYQNAVIYLRAAIEGFENDLQIYKLTASYNRDNWKNIFIDAVSRTTENMLVVPFSYNDKTPNPIETWYGYKNEYVAKPTDYIVGLFKNQMHKTKKPGDQSRGLKISIDSLEGNYFVKKYDLELSVKWSSDIILYRAADIHLLLAEALNRTGEHNVALNIVNDGHQGFQKWNASIGVRGRVFLEKRIVPAELEGEGKMLFIEDLIAEERAMELAFEGKRWFDLMRLARRRGNNYLADKVASKFSDPLISNNVRDKLLIEANWNFPYVK